MDIDEALLEAWWKWLNCWDLKQRELGTAASENNKVQSAT
jgi:hypothetical protein